MAKFFKNFVNDEDGFSAKDYLMVIFSTLFVIFSVVAFTLAIRGDLNPQVLEIIQSMDGILMTIVGGVFSVQVVKEFKQPKNKKSQSNDDFFPPNEENNI